MKVRLLIVLMTLSLAATLPGQIPEDRGLSGLAQTLDRLDVVGSVLHTGAHPDDENSALLAWLSRGQGVRTAYLSATRGEGGQNLIGDELFEALGVIRTEELLAARNYDRAQQFFTPNFEFGYSKTADETLEKWGRERLIGDFVRVIRQFRPEVIVSRFTGTPADGHGHHQAAGIATLEAFRAAADPGLYPEYGPPWQAKKLYVSGRGGGGGLNTGVRINVGEYGDAIGRSYQEIAMEGRSLHRTQSMGAAQQGGPRFTRLELVDKTVAGGLDEPIFARTTHRLIDLADLEPALRPDLEALQDAIETVRENTRLGAPAGAFPELVALLDRFQRVQEKATVEHVRFLLDLKEADFHLAVEQSAGLRVEVLASDETPVPGQEFDLTVAVLNGGPFVLDTVRTETTLPDGWEQAYTGSEGDLAPGSRFEQHFTVRVADDPSFSQPYWLREPRSGDRFAWPSSGPASLPFEAPLLDVRAELDYGGTTIEIPRHAVYRTVDEVYGEQRRLVKVVPELSVSLTPEAAVIPLGGDRRKEFNVTVENEAPDGGEAQVRLTVPGGWTVTPLSRTVRFEGPGETRSIQFVVEAPAEAGEFEVVARVEMDGKSYESGYDVIAYPHIETRHIYSDAGSSVNVFDVRTRLDNIGYVVGAGDRVPEALAELGIPVTFIEADDLSRGDLSVFDTIVLGIRAYAVREDLKAYNDRLLEYVSGGGTLIVQYNTYQILDGEYGPYPFTINRPHDRVTVEDAPVRFLEPDHPVVNSPNRLGPADFQGWVQERGLYFMGTWDDRYTPILESSDPGEGPKTGGMMVARVGEGYYVYTGYAFFRQLPAGVPGAYRLFANLISLGNGLDQ